MKKLLVWLEAQITNRPKTSTIVVLLVPLVLLLVFFPNTPLNRWLFPSKYVSGKTDSPSSKESASKVEKASPTTPKKTASAAKKSEPTPPKALPVRPVDPAVEFAEKTRKLRGVEIELREQLAVALEKTQAAEEREAQAKELAKGFQDAKQAYEEALRRLESEPKVPKEIARRYTAGTTTEETYTKEQVEFGKVRVSDSNVIAIIYVKRGDSLVATQHSLPLKYWPPNGKFLSYYSKENFVIYEDGNLRIPKSSP